MLQLYRNYFIWTGSWSFGKNHGLSISVAQAFPSSSFLFFFFCSVFKETTFGSKFKNFYNLLLMSLLPLHRFANIFIRLNYWWKSTFFVRRLQWTKFLQYMLALFFFVHYGKDIYNNSISCLIIILMIQSLNKWDQVF